MMVLVGHAMPIIETSVFFIVIKVKRNLFTVFFHLASDGDKKITECPLMF